MKRYIFLITAFTVVFASTFSQSPQAFKYQAIARNNSGEVLTEQSVSLKISLLQDVIDGTDVYVETYNTTFNDFGLINLKSVMECWNSMISQHLIGEVIIIL